MHVQDERNAINAGDRRGVANEIELEIIVQGRIDRVRSIGEEKRLAVRGRAHRHFGRDIAGSTRPVIDEKLLTQTVRQPLSDQARDYVDLTASSKANDDAHRPRWIDLR